MKITPQNPTDWYHDNGDYTKRLDYSINSKSVVVDIGAARGDWAKPIKEKYGCSVFCFEPVLGYYLKLQNQGFTSFNFAVLDHYGKVELGVIDGEASVYHTEKETSSIISCTSVPATSIFGLIEKPFIDLLKINVEGAEYAILNNLIEWNKISSVKNIQVQFHLIDNYQSLYEDLSEKLKLTHKLTWRYPFVWENWELLNK
jgi:FkbM family methyltransferase